MISFISRYYIEFQDVQEPFELAQKMRELGVAFYEAPNDFVGKTLEEIECEIEHK